MITPLSVSVVVGAMLASFVVSMLKRYQVVTIVGAIVMTVGVFLLTQMTISTSLLEAVIFMVIAGIGMGTFFAVVTLVAQNALPLAVRNAVAHVPPGPQHDRITIHTGDLR